MGFVNMTTDWRVWSEMQALGIPNFVVLASVTLAGTGTPRDCFQVTGADGGGGLIAKRRGWSR